jgi:hypothetical protein
MSFAGKAIEHTEKVYSPAGRIFPCQFTGTANLNLPSKAAAAWGLLWGTSANARSTKTEANRAPDILCEFIFLAPSSFRVVPRPQLPRQLAQQPPTCGVCPERAMHTVSTESQLTINVQATELMAFKGDRQLQAALFNVRQMLDSIGQSSHSLKVEP